MQDEHARAAYLVGVRFERDGDVQYYDPGEHELSAGDRVIVDTEAGPREAEVVIAPGQVLYSDLRGPLEAVLGAVPRDAEDR